MSVCLFVSLSVYKSACMPVSLILQILPTIQAYSKTLTVRCHETFELTLCNVIRFNIVNGNAF